MILHTRSQFLEDTASFSGSDSYGIIYLCMCSLKPTLRRFFVFINSMTLITGSSN